MLTIEQLKQVVHKNGLSQADIGMLCVAANGGAMVPTQKIRETAITAGVKGAKKFNFAARFASAKERVFLTPRGWELTDQGRQYVAELSAGVITVSPAAKEAQSLRALIPTLPNHHVRAFVTEAIVCAEQSLFRAAVVLSWTGAVALLYDSVIANHLSAFNAEATKRNAKWKPAKTADDLTRMQEYDFLQVISSLSLIGRNVKQELEQALILRNACGHPNSYKLGSNKVAAHLESLTLAVFVPFAK